MSKSKYKHLFFDLDHTIWDFESNSLAVLKQIFDELKLGDYGISTFEEFHKVYLIVNAQYWAMYHSGILSKEKLRIGRFLETLRKFRVFDIDLATDIAVRYTERSPWQTGLLPDAIETLEYLAPLYAMHIITNGFQEVQGIKIRNSNLENFFRHIFISEIVGHQKPSQQIFLHALQVSGAKAAESLMIGDNLQTDIAGAASVGIDQVFFNPHNHKHKESPTFEISQLKQLRTIL